MVLKSRCCLYINPPGDVLNSQLAPQGKAPRDFVLHHTGAGPAPHAMVGRNWRPPAKAWWSPPASAEPCAAAPAPTSRAQRVPNLRHMGTSTPSKAMVPSPNHFWRVWCTGGERAPRWGRKASAWRGGVHTTNWHLPPRCFRARVELAWKAKQIKCPKLIVCIMLKQLDQNQDLRPPEKWGGWTDT